MPRSAVVVTGAAGFIGRAVVRRLLLRGEPVLALVQTEAQRASLPHGVDARAGDLSSASEARSLLGDVDARAVIHLAGGRVSGGVEVLAENEALNLIPTRSLCAALEGRSIEALVLASTGEVYGPQAGPFVETLEPRPASGYARAKLSAEQAVLSAAPFGVPAVVARLSVAYGPGQEGAPMMIPGIVRSALDGQPIKLSPGRQTRDFIFVDDVAEALVGLARCPAACGQIVNVGFGSSRTVADVARVLLRLMGDPVPLELGALPYRPDELMDYRFDVARLETLTGYRATTSLEAGLLAVVAECGPSRP